MQYLINIFKPNAVIILVFVFLSAYFLSEHSQGFYTGSIDEGPPVGEESTVAGYPYVYFVSSPDDGMRFYARRFLKNLAIHYIITCLLVAFIAYVVRVFRDGDRKQRSFFWNIMIYSVVGIYVLFQVFGGDWLIKVARKERKKSIEILMAMGVDANVLSSDGKKTPLIVAAEKNNVRMARLFVERGAELNRTNKYGRTALHVAVMNDSLKMVDFLLSQKGININAVDYTQSMPIHYIQSYEMASLLIRHNARINFKNKKGLPPIFFSPDKRTMKLFISKGAKLDVPTDGGFTLIDSVKNPDIILMLVKAGANVNSQNAQGETPLHRLIKNKNTDKENLQRVIKRLVRRGANVDIRDKHGLSPLHYAVKKCDIASGALFFGYSKEVKQQLALQQFTGPLKFIVKNNRKCWQTISSRYNKTKAARKPVARKPATRKTTKKPPTLPGRPAPVSQVKPPLPRKPVSRKPSSGTPVPGRQVIRTPSPVDTGPRHSNPDSRSPAVRPPAKRRSQRPAPVVSGSRPPPVEPRFRIPAARPGKTLIRKTNEKPARYHNGATKKKAQSPSKTIP